MASTSALSVTWRRLKSKKKLARLPSGPPMLPVNMRLEKSGLLVEMGLRELRAPSLSLKPRLPRTLSLPGLVRISMRPKPSRSSSAGQGVGEIIGIVGEGGQIFTAQHQRGGVVVGFHAESGSCLIGDGDLLLFGGHHHLDGQHEIATGGDGHRLVDGCKAG